MADKLKDICGLNTVVKSCTKCKLHLTRTNAVCGEGNIDARIMLIAQAPGEMEDRESRMFIGPSGVILDELLKYAGIDKDKIYQTNLLKCILPKNRRPARDEIIACRDYLKIEILLIDPEIIVPLGFYAARSILRHYRLPAPQSRTEFREIYGKRFSAYGRKIIPLPHPACILHNRAFKTGILEQYLKLKDF